jgi:N-methylhydantoinase B
VSPPADPFTVEIVQSSLQAVSDEMFAALRKTAMSAIIYEVLDAGTGITDGAGNLASSGAGIPSFVGVLDKAVPRILELNDGSIEPGDVFVTNDPSYGGVTHLNDVVLALPVFADGEPVAWTAAIAHWNDVGGMAPGSISTAATEIFQEGLRLPAVKLLARGEPIESVLRLLEANSRLPHGTFELEEEQDSGAVYRVRVEVSDDAFVVDLRDNPDQDAGPLNVSRDGATIAAQMVLMNLVDAGGAANAGHFRRLRVLTRPGSVFDPREPAACGVYYEVRVRLYDLIWRCLAPHVGGRLPAGGFMSICGTFIGGRHPDTGRHFTIVEPEVGGWGASAERDGNSAQFSGLHGDTFNCPAEVAEARYGLYVDRLALDDRPGGEGERRGGKGILLDYRVRADGCFLTCAYTRHIHPPWPLEGGNPGAPNAVEVIRADGSSTGPFAVVTGLEVNEGDVIRIRTGSGGGWGDPRRRPPERVEDDLRNGYVSPERAAEVYGA